jgi:hypothetical protein
MSKTVTLSLSDQDGSFDAEEVVLCDQDSDYGVKRLDNDGVVVPAETPMEHNSTGEYSYTFEEPEEDLSYQAVIRWYKFGVYNYVTRTIGVGGVTPVPKHISFCAVVEGELVVFGPSELPQLCAPSLQWGVKNLDTGEVLVDAQTDFDAPSEGAVYNTSFLIVEDERYKFYVRVTVDGVEYFIPSTTTVVNSACLVIGRYTDSVQIGQRYGFENIHQWLSTPLDDKDEPVDYALRAAEFIRRAEEELDERLLGPYVDGPFEVTEDYEQIPGLVRRLATDLAGIKMYEARGVDDVNPESNEPLHRLRYSLKDVYATIRRVQMGAQKISGSASLTPEPNPQAGGIRITCRTRHLTDVLLSAGYDLDGFDV